jgi:F-type H+-transporting ATPase subunit epsilon
MHESQVSDLECIVVTPERTVRSGPAEFVTATLFDGEIGIARGHSPLIGRLGCGELRITDEGKTERLYLEGGFVEVLNNVVSILTNRAIPASNIDEQAAQAQLDSALNETALTSARAQAIAQARGQLAVARRAKAK